MLWAKHKMRLPDFVIIGAMKSATSTLHDQLAQQNGFFLSTPKEPCYFSDDDVFARGLDWYGRLFAAAGAADLCGESSTHYTKLPTYPHTVERMQRVLPDAKLIYMMRHPIDRLVSHYVHEWTENRVRLPIDDAVVQDGSFVDYSRYTMQLAPYIDAYGRDRILPLFMERVVRHPQETLDQIGRFLGCTAPLLWREELGAQNVGAERLRKSPLRDAIVEAPPLRALRRKVVPRAVRDWVKGHWQMREKPKLSPEVEARLRDTFDADLEQLGHWLGTPLSCKTYRETVTASPLGWAQASAV